MKNNNNIKRNKHVPPVTTSVKLRVPVTVVRYTSPPRQLAAAAAAAVTAETVPEVAGADDNTGAEAEIQQLYLTQFTTV